MDYEKLHKDTIAKLQEMVNSGKITVETARGICADFVPESEDDRIKRDIIEVLRYGLECEESVLMPGATTTLKEATAWLEKQDSQNLDNSAKTCKDEPKFHEGDWVILTAGELSTTLQIVNVDTNKKLYWFNDSSYLPIVDEECLHLWSIQDAKDGDVLMSRAPFIYGKPIPYGGLDWYNGKFIKASNYVFKDSPVHPATKEQRDLLFQKMKEAGYEWDAEKKELKKIEQKPEENPLISLKDSQEAFELKARQYDIELPNRGYDIHAMCKELYSLLIKQNPAWSEEDADAIGMAIIALDDMYDPDAPNNTYAGYSIPFNKAAERLKLIKKLKHWKPSDEQLEALDEVIRKRGLTTAEYNGLLSLWKEFKELRE